MRYYLDTNVLIFVLIQKKRDELSRDVLHILDDYANRFYVSSVAVRELIHAYKTNDIEDNEIKSVKDLFHRASKLFR